jgi:hypothetical protein
MQLERVNQNGGIISRFEGGVQLISMVFEPESVDQ